MRIQTSNFAEWLNDRRVEHEAPVETIVVDEERLFPPLAPDINIFGFSFIKHVMRLPPKLKYREFEKGYDATLGAMLHGDDHIKTLAAMLSMKEDVCRMAFSGFRAHPIDDMAYVAEAMALAANIYFGLEVIRDPTFIAIKDGVPVIGVHDNMIASPYGDGIPLRERDLGSTLRKPKQHCKRAVRNEAWATLYAMHNGDIDATRVIDQLFLTEHRAGERLAVELIGGRADYIHAKNLIDKSLMSRLKTASAHNNAIPQSVIDACRDVVSENTCVLPALFKILVPYHMKSSSFRTHIGDNNLQKGAVSYRTQMKISRWLNAQPKIKGE